MYSILIDNSIFFLVKGHHKHQGNVCCYMFCRFDTLVDARLKPLLSKTIQHRCHSLKKCSQVDEEEEACGSRPYVVRREGLKKEMHIKPYCGCVE